MRYLCWQKGVLAITLSLALMLTGCSTAAPATPEPAAQPVPVNQTDIISATGEVVPATWAALSFATAGQAVDILVEEGMTVQEGDVLARLDAIDLELAVARAEAAAGIAEANLALAEAGPRPEEIERAQDQLAAAKARVAVAVAEREALKQPPDENQVIAAQAAVQEAANAQQNTQEGYDRIIGFIENWDDYGFEPGDRTPLDGEQNARYALELANLRLAAAQANLDRLLAGPTQDQLRVADARVWLAVAQRNAAQAYLDLVEAGTPPADVAVADAEVQRARAAVEATRAALEQTVLVAPFSGTISTLNIDPGEWVAPGQPVLIIADLDTLQVKTTDLNELDVARIQVGNRAAVTFDALPDAEIDGEVDSIAPRSSEGAGVNYTVTIALSEIPEALRWGMTAFVDVESDQAD